MEHLTDNDLIKIKELLRHAGEFIAYFELAETRMIEWRQEIEQQAQTHHVRTQQQMQNLHHEFEGLQDIFTQAGLARLRLSVEQALKQGETHLSVLQHTSQQTLEGIKQNHQEFSSMVTNNLERIEQHTREAISQIDKHLSQYDISHFKQVAVNSYEQIEQAASDSVIKSSGLLKSFQLRIMGFILATTLLTTVSTGLYLNNEFPWEIHQHVLNERQAGKILMKAWPLLSEEEKSKIAGVKTDQKT